MTQARLEVDLLPPQQPRNFPFMHPVNLVCTWFGAGLSPVAPGTAGTLAALPFAFLIQYFLGNIALLGLSFVLFAAGCWASRRYIELTEREDPGEIVIDEVAAICLLLSLFPFTWQWAIACFLLFRLFDVLKPWPVSLADRKIKGGFGVMFDDLLAALYPVLLWKGFFWFCVFTGHQEWMLDIFLVMGTDIGL